MAFLFIDFLKQADVIVNQDSTKYNIPLMAEPKESLPSKSNFVVFGTYDWLHYGSFIESLSELKQQHEDRHMLSWQYERQPMFLYCRNENRNKVVDLFSASINPEYPLVLSLIQIDKAQISGLSCTIDRFLENIYKQIESLMDIKTKFEVFWNLGGSDVVIVFRTQLLEPVAKVLFLIQTQGFCIEEKDNVQSNKRIPAFSSSSHCALAIYDPICGVSEDVLKKWLQADQSTIFRALFETTSGNNGLINCEKADLYFVLGERDYEIPFPTERKSWASTLSRFLNPVQNNEDGTYHNHASFIIPEVKIEERPSKLAPDNYLPWSTNEDKVFDTLNSIKGLLNMADFAYGQSFENHQSQLEHCCNSLLGLYKYAYRLRSTIGQYNLFSYVRRLYNALEDTFQCYKKYFGKHYW